MSRKGDSARAMTWQWVEGEEVMYGGESRVRRRCTACKGRQLSAEGGAVVLKMRCGLHEFIVRNKGVIVRWGDGCVAVALIVGKVVTIWIVNDHHSCC